MSDYYSVLGLSPGADGKTIRNAYRKMVMTKHPDRFIDQAEKETAEKEFMAITAAYNVLSKSLSKQKYDSDQANPEPTLDPKVESEKFTKAGMAKLTAGEFYDAIQYLQQAVAYDPTNHKAHFHLGYCKAKNPKWRQEGFSIMEEVRKAHPMDSSYPFGIAELYLAGGLKERAINYYQAALKVDPTHEKSMARMQELQGGGKDEGSGLLGFLKRKG